MIQYLYILKSKKKRKVITTVSLVTIQSYKEFVFP